ncbi:hypothetical protein PpBr36_04489 [Pyricularia pennisetigena]|uniref:hypothetical protein n=1 Tax=Pyricularia pennisetigena TaxID=1578925 RepID=UPI001154BEFE|nr:hypothetical protein PpBr36_04489 [Pyricularia pennisetigena]TLS26476.1 hypothetical protein PpBr36_04489 [Pyricularia pennisetigena]
MSSRVLLGRAAWAAPSATSAFSRVGVTMPLRAKILSAKPEYRAQMSTVKTRYAEGEQDVLFSSLYGLRTIELNRPKKLNSLNLSMIKKITPRLLEWEKSDMANVIVMKGAGDKAFCAGGDVAALVEVNAKGGEGVQQSAAYFAEEYALDHLIATYQTPYIAFMDGITMGGGVGLSAHAPMRIATERTVFAMPETNIGFFPDVGASFFLPRLDGAIGTYLGLTGETLSGVNVFYTGIATHYMHSTTLPLLESRLAELRFNDYDSMQERLAHITTAIEEYTTGLPHDQPILLAGELRQAIDRCFSHDSVAKIVAALQNEAESGPVREWAQKTLDTLNSRSPTSLHVSLRQLRIAQKWGIRETFEKEHQLAAKFMASHDFNEGVTARLISKPKRNPNYSPAKIGDVDVESETFKNFFRPAKDIQRIKFLNKRDFNEYPFTDFGLPREKQVRELVQSEDLSQREVISRFVALSKARLGVKEVVEEIVYRKTVSDAHGRATWVN